MAAEGTARHWWTTEGLRWIIVTLLIPFSGWVWDQVQTREVERQKQLEKVKADEQARVANARAESEVVIRLMPALSTQDETSASRGIALAVLLNLANQKALSAELVSAVQVAVDLSQDRMRKGTASEAERQALTKLAAVNDRPAATTSDAPITSQGTQSFAVSVPRVYIQIFGDADADEARKLQAWISKEQRWLAPGFENVVAAAAKRGKTPPKGTSTGDVRYFHDEDKANAELIAAHLKASGLPGITVQPSRLATQVGQLEVWFPQR
jgi:hypothetical protein